MPRISIKDYNASFFHIMVQCIRKEYIFCDEEDKNKYLKLMYENLDKYEVKIIAYCIMGNHAHMLIYIENEQFLRPHVHLFLFFNSLFYMT